MAIVDAQSVKNTDTARIKGYDGGKKISGIKRHIVVDSQGLLHGVTLTAANVTDREGALKVFKKKRSNFIRNYSPTLKTQFPLKHKLE
jgi:hypothetical protein